MWNCRLHDEQTSCPSLQGPARCITMGTPLLHAVSLHLTRLHILWLKHSRLPNPLSHKRHQWRLHHRQHFQLPNHRLHPQEPNIWLRGTRLDSAQLTNNSFSLDIIDILMPTQPPTKDPSSASSVMPPYKHQKPTSKTMPPKLDYFSPSDIAKIHLPDMPDILPCNTTSPSNTRQTFKPLKIHQIFGCCRFRNPKHINSAAHNATLVDTGKPPATIGSFSTVPKVNEGKSKHRHCHFLEKFIWKLSKETAPPWGDTDMDSFQLM